jgi:hypothetical protein
VLTVPFASRAASVDISGVTGMESTKEIEITWLHKNTTWAQTPEPIIDLPFATYIEGSSAWRGQGFIQIPYYVKKINAIYFKAKSLGSPLGNVKIEIKQGSKTLFSNQTTPTLSQALYSIPVNLVIDSLKPSIMYVTVSPTLTNQWPYFSGPGGQLDSLNINAQVVLPNP